MEEKVRQPPAEQTSWSRQLRQDVRENFWLVLDEVHQLLIDRTLPVAIFRLALEFVLIHALNCKLVRHFDTLPNMALIHFWNTWNFLCVVRGFILQLAGDTEGDFVEWLRTH